ncbi:unnamed protein product, partial [Staurois parvus]
MALGRKELTCGVIKGLTVCCVSVCHFQTFVSIFCTAQPSRAVYLQRSTNTPPPSKTLTA